MKAILFLIFVWGVSALAADAGEFGPPAASVGNGRIAWLMLADGSWCWLDRETGSQYRSSEDTPGFGRAVFERDGETVTRTIDSPVVAANTADRLRFFWSAQREREFLGRVEFDLGLAADGRSLQVSWRQTTGEWRLAEVIFPDRALASTAGQQGVAVVPNRFGCLVFASDAGAYEGSWLTYAGYGGLSMAMAGMARGDSGVLLWWDDVDVSLGVRRSEDGLVDLSLRHPGAAGSVTLREAGGGGYVTLTGGYREVARAKGLLVTMKEKYGDGPNPIDGVMSFRPMVLYNFVPDTRWNATGELQRYLGFTFAEAADTAAFIRNELGAGKLMITFMGWGKEGYDLHPDVLPACAEAGGDRGLREAARRMLALGDILVGVHDNYQDFYERTPSWDERHIQRNRDGSLQKGGEWWNGQCYIANPKWSLELARRNLPEIRERFPLNYFYIDTTFAVPLCEDFNPDNPMNRAGDLRAKQELCRYARSEFGLFGSEEGVEWGVPVADYFESMLFQRTNRSPGEAVAPLFEMVYGDCVVICQGNRTLPATPDFVLDHLIAAEMPQLLFNKYVGCELRGRLAGARFLSEKVAELDLEWQASGGTPPKDYTVMLHLDHAGRNLGVAESAIGGMDFSPEPASSAWPEGVWVRNKPVYLELDSSVDGRYDVLIGLLDNKERLPLRDAVDIGTTRFLAGVLEVKDGVLTLEAPRPPRESCFARLDARPELSYTTEGLLVNVERLFSGLMRRTRDYPMTGHAWLSADRMVETSAFGPVTITVNYGETPYDTGRFLLPRWGFAIEAPDFTAFRADAVDGRQLSETTFLVDDAGEIFLAYGDADWRRP